MVKEGHISNRVKYLRARLRTRKMRYHCRPCRRRLRHRPRIPKHCCPALRASVRVMFGLEVCGHEAGTHLVILLHKARAQKVIYRHAFETTSQHERYEFAARMRACIERNVPCLCAASIFRLLIFDLSTLGQSGFPTSALCALDFLILSLDLLVFSPRLDFFSELAARSELARSFCAPLGHRV